VVSTGCTTGTRAGAGASPKVAVFTPRDAVPVTDARVWLDTGRDGEPTATLRVLRGDLADALAVAGATVCEAESVGDPLHDIDLAAAARQGRADGADAVVVVELIAYGQVRRSWLGVLLAQGFVAGVGHGVAAAQIAGPAAGWWVGLGEFALETATWVGGAILAAHIIDPVILRITAVRCADAVALAHWTRSGTRPFHEWWHRKGEAPRGERLRAVAGKQFSKVAARVVGKIHEQCVSTPAAASSAGGAARGKQ